MNSPHPLKHALVAIALATCTAASQPVLVRVTSETIARLQERDPMIRVEKPADGAARIVRPAHTPVVKDSTILHDGKNWTLVPNGALIHLPEAHRGKTLSRPVGHLMSWSDFLAANGTWLGTCEIGFDHAAGNRPLDPAEVARWKQSDKVLVAVHQNGPIRIDLSVAPSATASR